jgi:hypothetical protein
MRIFLIILTCLGIFGSVSAIVAFSTHDGTVRVDMIAWTVLILALNAYCARCLYKKTTKNKVEWALFCFVASFWAIVIQSLYQSASSNWKQGKRFFS